MLETGECFLMLRVRGSDTGYLGRPQGTFKRRWCPHTYRAGEPKLHGLEGLGGLSASFCPWFAVVPPSFIPLLPQTLSTSLLCPIIPSNQFRFLPAKVMCFGLCYTSRCSHICVLSFCSFSWYAYMRRCLQCSCNLVTCQCFPSVSAVISAWHSKGCSKVLSMLDLIQSCEQASVHSGLSPRNSFLG